jgi:hypothetical protein
MPKWKKDAKEFTVAVRKNEKRGYYSTSIPTPVIELHGKGEEVGAITLQNQRQAGRSPIYESAVADTVAEPNGNVVLFTTPSTAT